jgi:hypothetical protein
MKLGTLPRTPYRRSSAQSRTRRPRTASRGKRKAGSLWEGGDSEGAPNSVHQNLGQGLPSIRSPLDYYGEDVDTLSPRKITNRQHLDMVDAWTWFYEPVPELYFRTTRTDYLRLYFEVRCR